MPKNNPLTNDDEDSAPTLPPQITPYSLQYLAAHGGMSAPSSLESGTVGDLIDSDDSLDGSGAPFNPKGLNIPAKEVAPAKDRILAAADKPKAQDDISDSVSSSSAAPKGAPEANPLLVTADDLKNSADEKRRLAVLGAVGDNLSNRQSFGNFFLGHMNPQNNSASKLTSALSEQADQPVQQKMALQKQAQAAPDLQLAQDAMNPDSTYSKSKQDELRATLGALSKFGQMDPDKANSMMANVDSMNGFQSGKILDSLKPTIDILKAQGMLAMSQRKLEQGDERIGMQKDNQTNAAVAALDKDPLLQATQRQLNQIKVDRHTLQDAKIITPQMLHEISNGVAAALNQGKAVGLGMAEMQDMGTAQTKLAQIYGYLSNNPQDGASPEVKKQIIETLDRLESAYVKVQGARADQLKVGRNYQHNAGAMQALDTKVQSYKGESQPTQAAPDEEDQQALDWAKANPSDPRAMKILTTLHGKMNGGV